MEESLGGQITENAAPAENGNSIKNKGITKRPPNRQRFEEEINNFKCQIEEKEQQLQALVTTGKDSPHVKLQLLREGRDAAIQRRREINAQLEALNLQINCKRDASSQLRSKLQYQTETEIEEVVRKLEAQLRQHSFRLAEERRLVAEIDKLRRSKKAVRQYIDSKEELNQLRDLQQKLRSERDSRGREQASTRAQEDALHSEIRKNKDIIEILKKDLDELYERKRCRVNEFKSEQALFLHSREQRRTEANKQRAQEKIAQAQARAQDREEVRNNVEPYQEERQLCSTLMGFLAKFDVPAPATPLTPSSCNWSLASTPMSPDDVCSRLPGFKDEVDGNLASGLDGLFLGIPKKSSRKVKRSSSRACLNKKRLVSLTPELLRQFDFLSITAPTSVADVPSVMESLKAKQKLLNCMAAAEIRQTNSIEKDVLPPVTNEENTSSKIEDAASSSSLSPSAIILTIDKPTCL